jgi:hypothetical protein
VYKSSFGWPLPCKKFRDLPQEESPQRDVGLALRAEKTTLHAKDGPQASSAEAPVNAREEDAEEQRQRQASYELYTWYWLWATIVMNRADKIPNKYAHRLGVKRPGRPKGKREATPASTDKK